MCEHALLASGSCGLLACILVLICQRRVQREIRFTNVEGTKHAAEVHAEQCWVLQAHVTYRCKHFHRPDRVCIEFRMLATSIVKRMQVTLATFYGTLSFSFNTE